MSSPDRAASHTFRMSVEDKQRMRRTAEEVGLTMQQLFELKMFGEAKPRGRDGRPRKPGVDDQQLRLAG